MNLEVCKKCLYCNDDSLLVYLECDKGYSAGDSEVSLSVITIYSQDILGMHVPRCTIWCDVLISSAFLGEVYGTGYMYNCFCLNNDLQKEFFDLIKVSTIQIENEYIDGNTGNFFSHATKQCPCFLEHELYEWSVEK